MPQKSWVSFSGQQWSCSRDHPVSLQAQIHGASFFKFHDPKRPFVLFIVEEQGIEPASRGLLAQSITTEPCICPCNLILKSLKSIQ
jgi:hypothetical protein